MSLTNLLGVLQQYAGASVSNPPANAQQDFQNVTQQAPQEHLAAGLAEAFRSNQTPAFSEMLSNLFSQSNAQQRAGILNQLLGAVGPSLASGGLGASLANLLKGGTQVTPQQAEQVQPEAVQQLAAHAEKNNPSIIDEASNFYAQHPKLVQGLGAGALALIMSHMSKKV
jgi:hypothetical protein